MTLSSDSFTGDGVTTVWDITFEYLQESDVSAVDENGTVLTIASFPTPTQVEITPAVVDGTDFTVSRTTPTTNLVDFTDPAILNQYEAELNSRQLFYIAQELYDLTDTYVEEAPEDGRIYGRQDGDWVDITSGANVMAGSLMPGATAKLTSNETVSSGVTTFIPWEQVLADKYGSWDVAQPTRLTVPDEAGLTHARLGASVDWNTSLDGPYVMRIFKNGAVLDPCPSDREDPLPGSGSRFTTHFVSPLVPVAAGDYFELVVNQTSGSDRTILAEPTTFFSIEFVFEGT